MIFHFLILVTVVVISMFTQTLLGFQIPGSKANLNDICPPYVAIGKSISNTFGSMPGFIAPMIAGGLLDSYGNNQQTWGYIWALSGLGFETVTIKSCDRYHCNFLSPKRNCSCPWWDILSGFCRW